MGHFQTANRSIMPTRNHLPISSDSSHENFVWKQVKGRWRLVHGGMLRQGFSLEFHDFSIKEPLDWSASFHEHSMEICINLHGDASFRRGATTLALRDNQYAVYTVPNTKPGAIRNPIGHHCFYTLEFSRDWLRENLQHSMDRLKPQIRQFILRPDRARAFVECSSMPPAMIPIRIDLLAPPVSEGARDAWYYGKIFEILALTVYQQPSPPSAIEQRNRERVEHTRALIEHSINNPPSLPILARESGCSPFHLSRMFKSMLGISISDYQRASRMEKAAVHLRSGKSVAETAEAVGYSNVSAFIKAFFGHHFTTPSRWAALWREQADKAEPS